MLMSDAKYYTELRERFSLKRQVAAAALAQVGFQIYDSGSAFYLWACIPEGFRDAMQLNDILIRAGVAGVPGSAFADSDRFDNWMRFCIAREDDHLQGALDTIQKTVSERQR